MSIALCLRNDQPARMPGIVAMTNPLSISAVIITLNEEQNIRACLESVAWADEIVVVDSGSTDRTVDICREFTDRVFVESDWKGFGAQKNRALSHVTSRWVLSLDADERVSDALRDEILLKLRDDPELVLAIPRLSHYCGKAIRHSGWWPDHVVRVFRKAGATFSPDAVHERVVSEYPVCNLTQPLIHYSYRTLDDVLVKMNHYSSIWADSRPGEKSSLARSVFKGLWTFIRSYFLKLGFLDGAEGFALAVSNAEGAYYKYLKLYFRNKQRRQ